MKFILIFSFLFSSFAIIAQCDQSLQISDIEKSKFAKVYLAYIKTDFSIDQQLYKVATKYNFTPEKYRELQIKVNNKDAVTQEESNFIEEIGKLEKSQLAAKSNVLDSLILNNDILIERYNAILHQYRSCNSFHRSMSTYLPVKLKQ